MANGGDAGYPDGAGGTDIGGFSTGGGGGTSTSGGGGGNLYGNYAGAGGGFTASGPGSGGDAVYGGGGGGAGYYAGGGGAGDSGGGGGSDYCDVSVSDCQSTGASTAASVTVQYLAPQSITFPSTPVTYGQADFSPASSDSGLTVAYSNASGQCTIDNGGLLQITGAGSCTATADQAGTDEYAAAASVTQTFQVNPATVHLDADPASTAYGQPDPSTSATPRAGGFVNGDTAGSAGITGSASCQIVSHSPDAGTYTGAIICQPGTLSSPNYAFVAGNNAALVINATPPSAAPTPSASPARAEATTPAKASAPNMLSVALNPRTIHWSFGAPFPRLWLTFTLSAPGKVHLALQAREHGRWQAIMGIAVTEAAGTDRVQLVGRWHGALLPIRQLRLVVQARNAAGRSAAATVRFAVVHGTVQPAER